MTIFIILTVMVVMTLIGCYLLVKWHDRKIKETRDRAVAGGCPFFTDN